MNGIWDFCSERITNNNVQSTEYRVHKSSSSNCIFCDQKCKDLTSKQRTYLFYIFRISDWDLGRIVFKGLPAIYLMLVVYFSRNVEKLKKIFNIESKNLIIKWLQKLSWLNYLKLNNWLFVLWQPNIRKTPLTANL